MQFQAVFKRYEKKYLLNPLQYERLRTQLTGHMIPDAYGESTICNLYLDTEDHRIIRNSLEKPLYKEKLRLRSYGIPNPTDTVFLELKKKYKGVVYKRRIPMTLDSANAYLDHGTVPVGSSQIFAELNWTIGRYPHLFPAMYISYDRIALYEKDDPDLRITFDRNLLCREEDVVLEDGAWGEPLLQPGEVLMEIKIPGAMPLWLSHLLDNLKIFPISYSKYGSAYLQKSHIPATIPTNIKGDAHAS